jgi:competence protein ComEC
MNLEVELFSKRRDVFRFLLGAFFVFLLNVGWQYFEYKQLQSSKTLTADVLHHYTKFGKGRGYGVLKLQYKSSVFYITSLRRFSQSLHKVKIQADFGQISFLEYLKGFYIRSTILSFETKKTFKKKLQNFITSQHSNHFTAQLFNALFLAVPPQDWVREKIASFGVSHLVAISGFHLGFLSGILFFIFRPFYTFFQKRFFPYRNAHVDIMALVVGILFIYVAFLDFTPSLLRSFAMLCFGFLLYVRNFKIISYQTLFLTVVFLLALFPNLLFSIAFWLSVFGVFYIFLFLQYFRSIKKYQIFILLHFWVFFAMQPIVHFWFDITTLKQLLSPFVSMLFYIFYPLEFVLHLIGYGGLLDEILLNFFGLEVDLKEVKVGLLFFVSYIVTSMLATYKKVFLYLSAALVLLFNYKFLLL